MQTLQINMIFGMFGTLFFGVAVLGASRLLSDRMREGHASIMDAILETIGWTLIWCSIISLTVTVFTGVPVLPVVVLIVVYIRNKRARKYALLSTLGVAAERMMPLVPVIDAYAKEQKGRIARQARLLSSRLQSGWLLPDALDGSRGLVSRRARAMIRTGFESGALAAALKNAGGDPDAQDTVWAQLSGRLVYLAMIVAAANLMIVFVSWRIAPAFEKIFWDFSVDLPGFTVFTIAVSNMFVRYGGPLVFLPAPLAWFLIVYIALRYSGLIEWDLPGMTRLARRLHTATILDTLTPLAQQDRPLIDGIATLAKSYPKRLIRRRLKLVLADLQAGADWCDSMVGRRLMTRADSAVLAAATRVGNLPWAMMEMADSNRRRLAYRCQIWLQLAFALVTLVLGLAVLIFCVSFFLPLVNLVQGMV
jgi:type II secretory pathway component PulF